MRVVAIDWSGRAKGESEYIWAASVQDGQLQDELRNGRSRAEVTEWLAALPAAGPVVVGLDFAFSFPRWWCEESGWETVEDVWQAAEALGEKEWLANPTKPFWGRAGLRRELDAQQRLRRTEGEVAGPAKSVFQIGGAGAVGTGSIRGMPELTMLLNAGYTVWPFHSASKATVVEIYPRAFIGGGVNKSSWSSRHAYLTQEFPEQPAALLERAAGTEDAFDAAVSALVMSRYTKAIGQLRASTDARYRIEGRIWTPGVAAQGPSADWFEPSDKGRILVIGRPRARKEIRTVDDWRRYAPPLGGDKAWRDGYSAKESAKAWLGSGEPRVPAALAALLDTDQRVRGASIATVLPEHDTRLGDGGRGPRRHDLLILGRTAAGGRIVIGVETKTDEPFDSPLYEAFTDGLQKWKEKPASTKLARVQCLSRALFGAPLVRLHGKALKPNRALMDVPYQLVAGAAGTLIEASKASADVACFIALELGASAGGGPCVSDNADGFRRFAAAFGEASVPGSGRLVQVIAPGVKNSAPGGALLIGITAMEVKLNRPPRSGPSERSQRRKLERFFSCLDDPALRAPPLASLMR